MIAEDYCSFEVAKLLKEKGFDSPCMGRYSVRSKEFHLDCTKMCNNGGLFECAAPSQAMAMKWLRKVHQLHISIKPTWVLGDMKEPCRWEYDIISLATAVELMYYVGNSTYEEAVEAACLYSLENLI